MTDKQIDNYRTAIFEANRFIELAGAAIYDMTFSEVYGHSKCNASAKRSSMDLTNALVSIRR